MNVTENIVQSIISTFTRSNFINDRLIGKYVVTVEAGKDIPRHRFLEVLDVGWYLGEVHAHDIVTT